MTVGRFDRFVLALAATPFEMVASVISALGLLAFWTLDANVTATPAQATTAIAARTMNAIRIAPFPNPSANLGRQFPDLALAARSAS
jgi:hypothetical protein